MARHEALKTEGDFNLSLLGKVACLLCEERAVWGETFAIAGKRFGPQECFDVVIVT